jgi:hypothetical protein
VPYSKVEITEYSKTIGKSVPTLWRWIRQGCDLRDRKSVREWVTRNTIRETNILKSRKRRRQEQTASERHPVKLQTPFQPAGNSELPPASKRGAAAALERLEFLLNAVEREAFDSPPIFNSFQRKQYFEDFLRILSDGYTKPNPVSP